MANPRTCQSAAVLTNGKVLITGGYGSLTSAELYDPAMNSWSDAGSIQAGRACPTSTRLTDGRVLVVGGTPDNSAPVASAELYDPTSNSWSSGGSLTLGRWSHTATLLTNGKVLVAGGYTPSTPGMTDTELYDPAANTWSTIAPMGHARQGHTATPLTDGRILIAGGHDGASYVAPAELFDPGTNTWGFTGSLSAARNSHIAALLPSGIVLIAGGFGCAPTCGVLNSAEIYDPGLGTFSATGGLATARYGFSGTALATGQVLVEGGLGAVNGAFLASAELYTPSTFAWTSAGTMSNVRCCHTSSLLLDGRVLVAGGPYAAPETGAEIFMCASGPDCVPHLSKHLDDAWTAPSIDASRWIVHQEATTSAVPSTDGLILTLNSTPAADGASLDTTCFLLGDYDAQMEFVMDEWVPSAAPRIGLGDITGPVERNDYGYITHFPDGIIGQPAADSSGRLRMTRTGSTLTGYFWDGAAWVLIHSYANANSGATRLSAALWDASSGSAQTVVRLRNFTAAADGLDCPDTDSDGLRNDAEWTLGTDPLNADTDADGISDGTEVDIYHTDPLNGDTDADGCGDGKEVAADHQLGGQRNPLDAWDFADVPVPALLPSSTSGTRNKIITLSDVLADLEYVGTSAASPNTPNANGAKYGSDLNGNGILDGVEYDRTPSTVVGEMWRSGPPNGVITLSDVLVVLAQVGTNCS